MPSTDLSIGLAAAAAKQILGFYDSIPAKDKEAFTAGVVELLSTYPQLVIQRAVSPARGLPGLVAYPNLAKFKAILDGWAEELWEEERVRRAKAPRLEAPPPRLTPRRIDDPPAGHFGNVHIPASHPRYAKLCEWAKTAEPKFWRYGKSSESVDGIWIPHSIWEDGTSAFNKAMTFKVPTPEILRQHYDRHDLAGKPKAKVWNETEDEH